MTMPPLVPPHPVAGQEKTGAGNRRGRDGGGRSRAHSICCAAFLACLIRE